MDNRPHSREENVKTGKSAGLKKRGDGLGSGPVGNRTEEFIQEHYKEALSKDKKDDDPDKPAGRKSSDRQAKAPQGEKTDFKPDGKPSGGTDAPDDKGLGSELLGSALQGMLGGNNSGSGISGSLLSGLGDLLDNDGASGGGNIGGGNSGGGSNLNFGGNIGGGNIGGGNGSMGGNSSSGSGSSGGSSGRKKGIPIIAVIVIIVILFFVFRGSLCGGSSNQQQSGTPLPTASGNSSANSSGSSANNNSGSSSLTDILNNSTTEGGTGIAGLLSGYNYDNYYNNYNYDTYSGNSYGYSDYSGQSYGGSGMDGLLEALMGAGASGSSPLGDSFGSSYGNYFGNTSSSSWNMNTGTLNTNVVSGTPAKRTVIEGGGKDKVTLMVYICGSDLESGSGAATMDIQEMLAAATNNENLNIILYTGGASSWQNNVVSSSTNQMYQIRDGQLYRIANDLGRKAMTDPNTLKDFISFCSTNYPANRNMLILWDHGGGSVSGYAYDENFKTSGYMSLAGINTALKNSGVTFDMIGFDTCLMATVENGLMLSKYADYLVGSEEVEPSTGWYYTDWLTALNSNTSIPTAQLGKTIVDSFISASESSAWGLGCTLSVVDLAELSYTVPEKLSDFADDISGMIESGNQNTSYKTVQSARSNSKEFGETQSLDQIDLVNFADNIGTKAANELSEAVKSAVKYNQVSRGTSNAYGLSIFFPYNRVNYVSAAASVYNEIGLSEEYISCIRKFASVEGGGQSLYGASSGYGSLIDALTGGNSYSGSSYSSSDVTGLLSDLFSGYGRELNPDAVSEFLAKNRFDASALVWQKNENGEHVIHLPEDQWSMVDNITLNAFYDDGEGYIDLGSDSYFQLNENGDLIGSYNGTWLSIDDNIVAYYFDSMTFGDDYYSIRGHVPVLYNGVRANLVIVFDSSNPKGYIAGVSYDYKTVEEGGMAAKTISHIEEGSAIDFTADYYTYKGDYVDSYMIGDQWKYHDGAEIANIKVDGDILALYQFKDIYNNIYLTPEIPAEK